MNHWPHQSECLKRFGNPSSKAFVEANLASVAPPFTLRMGEIEIEHFLVNKLCAESLTRIFEKAWEKCGRDPAKISHEKIDRFSGAFAVRQMRGLRALSMHAFGLAIDFDAAENPLAERLTLDAYYRLHPRAFKPDSLLVALFKEEGWMWGGDWTGRKDPMHFQAAIVG